MTASHTPRGHTSSESRIPGKHGGDGQTGFIFPLADRLRPSFTQTNDKDGMCHITHTEKEPRGKKQKNKQFCAMFRFAWDGFQPFRHEIDTAFGTIFRCLSWLEGKDTARPQPGAGHQAMFLFTSTNFWVFNCCNPSVGKGKLETARIHPLQLGGVGNKKNSKGHQPRIHEPGKLADQWEEITSEQALPVGNQPSKTPIWQEWIPM